MRFGFKYLLALIVLLFISAPSFAHCDDYDQCNVQANFVGQGISVQNVELGNDTCFELSYDVLGGSMQDDFTVSLTTAEEQVLRSAAASGGTQQVLLIIKYEEEESGRPQVVPFISFFIPGTLGTTNVIPVSSNSNDCTETHIFNIADPQVSSLFANNQLDFHFLVNLLNQGPANRLGQRFRVSVCLNCSTSTPPPVDPGPSSLPLPGLDDLSKKEQAIEDLKDVEDLLDSASNEVSGNAELEDKVEDLIDDAIDTLSKMHGNIGLDSNASSLGSSAVSKLKSLQKGIDSLIADFQAQGASTADLITVKTLIDESLTKFSEGLDEDENN